MARGSNYTVQQILQQLKTNQFDDSCDEDEETEVQDENLIPTRKAEVQSSDSDTDSSEDEHDSAAASGATPSDNSLSQNTVGELKAQNGTVWKNITGSQNMGRAFAANLFSERPGPKSYCHRAVLQGSPYSAFHLFIDKHMLRFIQKNTNN